MGGWQDEFLSPGNFKEKQKEDAALLPEFEESRTEFINMSNSGGIKDKVQRCDKDKMNLSRNKWQKKLQDKSCNGKSCSKNLDAGWAWQID